MPPKGDCFHGGVMNNTGILGTLYNDFKFIVPMFLRPFVISVFLFSINLFSLSIVSSPGLLFWFKITPSFLMHYIPSLPLFLGHFISSFPFSSSSSSSFLLFLLFFFFFFNMVTYETVCSQIEKFVWEQNRHMAMKYKPCVLIKTVLVTRCHYWGFLWFSSESRKLAHSTHQYR